MHSDNSFSLGNGSSDLIRSAHTTQLLLSYKVKQFSASADERLSISGKQKSFLDSRGAIISLYPLLMANKVA